MKIIVFHQRLSVPEAKCSGCRYCEAICSYFHFGECNPKRSAIRVMYDGHGNYTPNTCKHCQKPKCVEACPTKSIVINGEGYIEVNKKTCIGCGVCVTECPFKGIYLDPVDKKAISCDICGGDPQCVKYCAPHVLTFTDEKEVVK